MFALGVLRHRNFELGRWTMPQPAHPRHRGYVRGYRHGFYRDGACVAPSGAGGGKANVPELQQAMGITWTDVREELTEAIPPGLLRAQRRRPAHRHPSDVDGGMNARLLSVALDAAGFGWHVFPLHPRDKRPTLHGEIACPGTGDCASGHQKWEQRAITDRIRKAWSTAAFNVGLATGPSRVGRGGSGPGQGQGPKRNA